MVKEIMKNNYRLFGDMKLCNVCCIKVKDKNCKLKTKYDLNFVDRGRK